MKPLSIVITIVLGLVSLGIIVWVGQYRAYGLVKPQAVVKPDPTPEDLPLPKSGPFGKVEINEIVHDFGTKLVGSSDKHTFTIRNVGEGSLAIKLGKPTCQCTIGEITKIDSNGAHQAPTPNGEEVSLATNEAVNIDVQWVMKTETEKFRQQVPVFTTDPDRRKIDIEITGMIEGPFHVLPSNLWEMGELSRTEPSKAEGIIYSAVLDEFSMEDVPRTTTALKISWQPVDAEFLEEKKARSGYRVLVEVGPDVPIGQYRETFRMKLEADEPEEMHGADVKTAPAKAEAEGAQSGDANTETTKSKKLEYTADIQILAHRSGPLEIRGVKGATFSTTSNRIIFGEFSSKEGKKAKLTLFPKGMTEELVLKGVEPADTPFKITLGAGVVLGNTKSYSVEVEIPPGVKGFHQTDNAQTVDLKLNHPEAPDLRLLIDYNAKD